MDYKDIPETVEKFNESIEKGVLTLNLFWAFDYDLNLESTIFSKALNSWVVYYINNYYAIGLFTHCEGEVKNLRTGKLIKFYAVKSILNLIYELDTAFWNRSFRSDFYKKPIEINKRYQYMRYSHYIYVDTDFSEIISNLSNYFENFAGLYPVDSDDRAKPGNTLKKKWDYDRNFNEYQFYSELSHSSQAALSMDYIVGISLKNTHRYIADYLCMSNDYDGEWFDVDSSKLEISNPIPDVVYDNCKNVPHIIRIDYSRNHFNSLYQEVLINDLANIFGGNAYILTPEFDILAKKTNIHIPEHEKTYFLYERTKDYFGEIALENIELDIKLEIGDVWEELHANSKKFLCTGFFLYNKSISGSKFLLDTSHASLAFSKCIENEMVQRIVIPFKQHFENNYKQEDLSLDLKDLDLKRMTLYLVGKNLTPPELGSFAYFLENVINSKSRAKWSVSIKAFKSFSKTCKNPDFLLNKELLFTMLSQIARKYRNGGAHIKVLPIEYVSEFYDILFKKEFIRTFINSTESVI